MSHVYCGECGFQNPEASNYCSRCGARLEKGESGEQTMTFTPEEIAEDPGGGAAGHRRQGAGAGRSRRRRQGGGELFPSGERTLIGRSPECDVFLDDVTVSRKHAELLRDGETFTISDLGSLNGTFVNKKRIESAELEDDDEVQIGKYRLTFLRR